MNKARFTPGPFEVVKRTGLWIVRKDNKVIATMHSESDARLMADAQELLKALGQMLECDRLAFNDSRVKGFRANAQELLKRHGG